MAELMDGRPRALAARTRFVRRVMSRAMLVAVSALVLVATTATVAQAATTVDQFVANTMGQGLSNAAGTYQGECVSLVSQYLLQVYGVNNTGWNANAIDYQAGGNGGNQLAAHGFNWSTDQNFANGDILVWGPSAAAGTSSLGHVGIWYGGKVYDQNDGRHSPARVAGYSTFWSGGYLGHWRNGTPPPSPSLTASTPKSAFNTGEHVVVNWTAYPGATKYGLTVWKAPYTGDANIVWDNYVTGTSMDIGTLPLNSYRIHMAAYVGTTLVKLSNYCDFSVVNPPDITAPQTTSNRVTYYATSATIHLTPTDLGGSGVAHTYYRLNGAAQVEGTTITKSTAGSYSLVYWSIDAAGNIEAPHTVTFTIIAKPSTGGTPSTPASIATLKHGKSFTVYGYIIKHTAGTYPVTLQFYRYQSGHWVLRKSTTAKASTILTFSKYSDSTSVPYSGKWRVRARHKVGTKYLYSGYRAFTAS